MTGNGTTDPGADHPRVVRVERVIPADAATIFDVLADPRQHRDIDGSGSVKDTSGTPPERLALGSRFGMSMRLGVPYVIRNEVVEFDEGRRIAWRHYGHHVWRYTVGARARRDQGDRGVRLAHEPGAVGPRARQGAGEERGGDGAHVGAPRGPRRALGAPEPPPPAPQPHAQPARPRTSSANPERTAQAATSARLDMCSLVRMLLTCTAAVFGEMNRRRASSPLVRPSLNSAATSRSRPVSSPSGAAAGPWRRPSKADARSRRQPGHRASSSSSARRTSAQRAVPVAVGQQRQRQVDADVPDDEALERRVGFGQHGGQLHRRVPGTALAGEEQALHHRPRPVGHGMSGQRRGQAGPDVAGLGAGVQREVDRR